MCDYASWAGIVVGLGSLAVSIIAVVKSSRAQHEANDVNRRLVEIEEKREQDRLAGSTRAELRAELRITARNTTRLYVINYGLAEARNVTVTLDKKPLAKHEAGGDELASTIGPKSEVSCILMTHMMCAPPFGIEITWEDDSGEPRSYSSTLTR